MFSKKKQKTIKLIDFSIQEVSTGQVKHMLKYLEDNKSRNFKSVNVDYGRNDNGDTRCYLTMEYSDGRVIQWFKDRSPSQVEEFAKKFKMNDDGDFVLKD